MPPCPEATRGTYTRVDERTFKSAEDHDRQPWCRQPWLSEGVNHRKVRGGIARDFPGQPCWVIEVGTLEELWSLVEKHGPIIVSSHFLSDDQPGLEIYDDYRE